MKPYYQDDFVTLFHGRCEDVLPGIAAADVVITDPPYGVDKADWDMSANFAWMAAAARITQQALVVMPGIDNVILMPKVVLDFRYRWMLSIHISNGMTRGRMGFGNWIPAVVYGRDDVSLYQPQQDATTVPIEGEMPNHPSPKPLRAMRWLVSRFPKAQVFLDPFAGSGTTGVAAKALGRRCILIERDPVYCELIVSRLSQEVFDFEGAPV